MTDRERFESKRIKGSGCWEWKGFHFRSGHCVFWVNGRNVQAHRYAWEMENGPIPEGMCVCHHCDNGYCTRPDHLFLGTHADNMHDRALKGRYAGLRGEDHPMVKLVADDVREIRDLYRTGATSRQIAEKFPVTIHNIRRIVQGRTWKHLLTECAQ